MLAAHSSYKKFKFPERDENKQTTRDHILSTKKKLYNIIFSAITNSLTSKQSERILRAQLYRHCVEQIAPNAMLFLMK